MCASQVDDQLITYSSCREASYTQVLSCAVDEAELWAKAVWNRQGYQELIAGLLAAAADDKDDALSAG